MRAFFFSFYLIIVPLLPSMAVASVMFTCFTPAAMASSAFSIFGIMPPCIVPSATYRSKSDRVITGITLSSSPASASTPFF